MGILAVASLSFLSSCKDDEETPIAGIQFEIDEQEVTESDGTPQSFHPDELQNGQGRIVTAKLIFDIPLAGDVVLKFDIDGSARAISTQSDVNDYEIVEEGENITIDGDQITIAKGATEAFFSVRIFEDFNPEIGQEFDTNEDEIPYENIVISLESVVSGPGKIGENDEHEIKILEDDAYVFLIWQADDSGNAGDVDMDLFIYINGTLRAISDYTNDQFTSEIIAIPGGFQNGTYGMSYVYKSGTSDNVDFMVEIANFGGTLTSTNGETGVVFTVTKTYGLANINNYNPESPTAFIAQTMVKNGLNYTDLTDVSVQETGSRSADKSILLRNLDLRKKLLRSNITTLK